NKNGVQFYYSKNPLAVIISIIQKFKERKFSEIVDEKCIPLVINVLSSAASLDIKESYLEFLIELLVEYKRVDKEIPRQLKEFFITDEIALENEFSITGASVISSRYYINTINSILGSDIENNIFDTCIGYKEKRD
ncbi:hypothetical protein OEN05_002759, partial [Enterococcus faecalis]|nr:hypothetical protein [Enterococcus faecalis]